MNSFISREAAEDAGFNVLRVISQPAAAALAYGNANYSEQIVLYSVLDQPLYPELALAPASMSVNKEFFLQAVYTNTTILDQDENWNVFSIKKLIASNA